MMILYGSLVGCFVVGAVLASFWMYLSMRGKVKGQLQTVEARAKSAEVQAYALKQQLESSKSQANGFKRDLDEALHTKEVLVDNLRNPFRKEVVLASLMVFGIGCVLGSGMGAYYAGSQEKLKGMEQRISLEIRARLAESKESFLSERVSKLSRELSEVRNKLLHEREITAVRLAKMSTVLEHFADPKAKWVPGLIEMASFMGKDSQDVQTAREAPFRSATLSPMA